MRILLALVVLLVGCTTASEHGHPHGEDGGHSHEDDGRPTFNLSVQAGDLEIFVKYAALVKDRTSTFETYVTRLSNYKPVDSLVVTTSLVYGGKGIRHSVESPNINKVYLPALRPNQAGVHTLWIELNSAGIDEKLDLGEVTVYENNQQLSAVGHDTEGMENISFTKKQAWAIDFEVSKVEKAPVYQIIGSSGVWSVAPGDSRTLVANANGIINYNQNLLTEGALVKKGQPLMTITSKGLTNDNLEVEIEKAKADHNQITAEYNRQQALFEGNLIPKAEFERSESRYFVSKASIEALQQGYIEGGKQIQVPFDGFIRSIDTHNGDYVSQGMELFTVVSLNSQILEIRLSPIYDITMDRIQDVWFKPINGRWESMKESGGNILSIGQEVTEEEPLIPIYAKVNTSQRMPQGSFSEVQVAVGDDYESLVIPESALLEDYGKHSVMVQIDGENYEKRTVSVGNRNGQLVEITSGLQLNEKVVSKGAYQVKMASMSSSVPGHGHEH
jgi:RND family efflux transporter MFP subunit